MTDYGKDVSTFVFNEDGMPDLDPLGREISGLIAVAECALRVWEPVLIEEYDNDCSPVELQALGARLAFLAQEDERVHDCNISVSIDGERMKVIAFIHSDYGAFDLVGALDDNMVLRILEIK